MIKYFTDKKEEVGYVTANPFQRHKRK